MVDAGTVTKARPAVVGSDITLFKGANAVLTVTIGSAWAALLDGSYDVYFTVKDLATSSSALIDKACAISDAGTGTLTVTLASADTNVRTGDKFRYQIQIVKSDGSEGYIALYGDVAIDPALRPIETS